MKIVRFKKDGKEHLGIMKDNQILSLTVLSPLHKMLNSANSGRTYFI